MDRPADPPQDAAPGQSEAGRNPLARLSAITGNARPVVPPTNGTTPAPDTPERRLGRLERVHLNRLWPTDAAFSRWLADNLDAVGDPVSLRLAKPELLEGELPVVLASAGDGTSAVVLAQRGPSTDDAFGSLVRHFAASAAQHAVWICGAPSSEHVAAVSWLNRSVDGRFVMLRVGAVTIGESAAAPTFELAVRSPRSDDPNMESAVPEARRADDRERRADDWLGSLRPESVAAEDAPSD